MDNTELPTDSVGLLAGLATTRAIRRYTNDPVPDDALRAMLFAATRAPSGSNRQPFRFLVLRDGPVASEAKRLIASAARALWDSKRKTDGYDDHAARQRNEAASESGSPSTPNANEPTRKERTPKERMAASMDEYVNNFASVPLLVLPCFMRYRAPTSFEGASIYPACQNLLLAARALGFGGVLTGFHAAVESELRALCAIPDEVVIAATITIGKPQGSHGPVRRRPLRELISENTWSNAPVWAIDPPGTSYTQAGPPGHSPKT